MEVDNDIDSQLLQQFSSMGTNDREVLIAEFQRLLGDQLNPSGCAFYLDMNNWNLQAAICSYYDLEHPAIKLPSMSFVKDITIGEGESIPPSTHFVKTWRIQNSGDDTWPPGCCLKYVNGVQFGNKDRAMVSAIQPGAVTDVSVEMISPSEQGVHQGQWRMSTPTGSFFGEFIWVIVQVEDNGLMGVTQQLSQFGTDFAIPSPHSPVQNPFASPVKDQNNLSCGLNPYFSPGNQNPPGTNGIFVNGHMGSPIGSDIAEHGSFPNSPCVPAGVHGNGSQEGLNVRSSESVRTALFQNTEASLNATDVILLQENQQGHQVQQTDPNYVDEQMADSVDMS